MNTIPVANYLANLSLGPIASMTDLAPNRSRRSGRMEREQIDIDAEIQASYERGLEDGKRSAEEQASEQFNSMQDESKRQLASARADWVENEGARISAALQEGLRSIEDSVGDSVARILEPYLLVWQRQHAVASLLETLDVLLKRKSVSDFKVSGPADLLDIIRDSLSTVGIEPTFETNGEPDVEIVIDDTIMRTQISEWMKPCEENING